MSKSISKYNLPVGVSVKELDKVSGLRLSGEVAEMLLRGITNFKDNEAVKAAEFIKSLKLSLPRYTIKFGRGGNKEYTLIKSGKELTAIANQVVAIYEMRVNNIHLTAGIEDTPRTGGGGKKVAYNFNGKDGVKGGKKIAKPSLPEESPSL